VREKYYAARSYKPHRHLRTSVRTMRTTAIRGEEGTHLRGDTVILQWFQASKAAAASDGHAVHC